MVEMTDLTAKLELIKEATIGFKFVADDLQNRVEKLDVELAVLRAAINRFENHSIRTDERIANIERYIDTMRGDIRSVRNAVLGSVIAATLIGIAGLAIIGLSERGRQTQPTTTEQIRLK
jgi:hypothetical protein